MKTWMKMLIAVAVMAMMAACHPDEKNAQTDTRPNPNTPVKTVFMSISVSLPPTGPAAKADGDIGDELGQPGETKISSMLVVIADTLGNYITHGTMVAPKENANSVTGVASMDQTALDAYYMNKGKQVDPASSDRVLESADARVNVFVFCNYTQELLNAVKESGHSAMGEGADTRTSADWIHAAGTVGKSEDESIWSNGNFLMSNQAIARRQIPLHLQDWNQKYGDENTPFKLSAANGDASGGEDNGTTNGRGPITVERVMARIDLKDGSTLSGNDNAWTYPIGTTGAGSGELRVRLERVAMVNQSKTFYFLKHTAPFNAALEDIVLPAKQTLCGQETSDNVTFNFVVDADAGQPYKMVTGQDEDITPVSVTYQNYMYPLFDEDGRVDDGVRRNWDAKFTSEFGKEAYKPWTYVTENTTPHTNNRAGITTGIVFKGRLLATEGVNAKLKAAINGEYQVPDGQRDEYYLTQLKVNGVSKDFPLLYAFGESDRRIYVGWNDQVKEAAKGSMAEGTVGYAFNTPIIPEGLENAEKASPNDMFKKLLEVQKANDVNSPEVEAAREKFKTYAVAAGFTVYQASYAASDGDTGTSAEGAEEDAGYFCYYFYWIRHNLVESTGVVNPMEYGVVRNNVYKISVKTIRRFGHPRLSFHDTDPMTVNTPCERSERYMQVEVKVANWVTRESEIVL